jgi:competence protein ComEA
VETHQADTGNRRATAVLGLGSAAVWFLRDAGGLFQSDGPAEGSLRVNLNTATLTELESIPGIGESLAAQIVAHRPYTSVDQLVAIRGIGPSSIESLRPYVKVDGEAEKLR